MNDSRAVPNRRIALFPSAIAFEDFFGQIGVSREQYVRGHRDWSVEYVTLWNLLGFETTFYLFSRELEKPQIFTRETDPHCTIKFFPMPVLTRFAGAVKGRYWLATYMSSLSHLVLKDFSRQRPDVIWVQEYESPRFDVLVAIGKLLGIPVVGQHQGAEGGNQGRAQAFHHRSIYSADKLLCLNRMEFMRMRQQYPDLPDDKLEIFHNPVDNQFSSELDRNTAKEELNLPPDRRYILFVGRLIPVKGLSFLLEAFALLREAHGDIDLLIVGTGPLDTELRESVRSQCWQGVCFRGWTSSTEELGLYYRACEFLVVPSLREPFGVVATEAMACHRPIVGTRVAGLLEQVVEGRNGFLVEPADSASLAERMKQMLDHPAMCEQMGQCAYEIYSTRFSFDAVGAQMQRILAELIGEQ